MIYDFKFKGCLPQNLLHGFLKTLRSQISFTPSCNEKRYCKDQTYLEPCKTSMMELFLQKQLTAKSCGLFSWISTITEVWQGPKDTCETFKKTMNK